MSDNLKIFKNSLILFARLLITSVTTLFISRIVLQSLGASDFGLYSVVGGIVVIVSILNNVMVSTSFRYIAVEIGRSDLEEINKVFNISLVINAGFALFGVLLAETAGTYYISQHLNVPAGRIDDALFVFHLSVLTTFLTVFSMPFQGLITAHEKFSVRSLIEVAYVFLKLIVALVLLHYLGNRLRLFALLIAGAAAVQTVLYVVYCRKKYASAIRWNFQRDIGKYKEMVGFSGWIMLGAGACIGQTQGTALIINSFFGTILNASLGIASQVNSTVLIFSQNLSHAAIPQITQSYSSGNSNRTIELVCYISKYSFFLMMLPALPILLELDFILKLWLNMVPEYTSIFCRLMIIAALIGTASAGIAATVQATGKIKYFQIILSTISLLSLPVAYILYHFGFPPYSILVVYIVTALLNLMTQLVLLKVVINFDIKTYVKTAYLKIIYVVLLVLPLFLLKDLLPEGFLRFALMLTLAISWNAAAVYLVGIEPSERAFLRSALQNVRIRFHNWKLFAPAK